MRGVRRVEVAGKEVALGAALSSDGSALLNKTGGWRSLRPVVDPEKCTGCGTCWVFCPEGCVVRRCDGKFEPNLDYCKGCGICSQECKVGAITMVEEVK